MKVSAVLPTSTSFSEVHLSRLIQSYIHDGSTQPERLFKVPGLSEYGQGFFCDLFVMVVAEDGEADNQVIDDEDSLRHILIFVGLRGFIG